MTGYQNHNCTFSLSFFSTLEPLGDQTVVALTTHVSGLEGCWGSGQDFLAACFWWNSSGDLFSYASRPKWHYTFLSPSLFACSLISDMRGPDIPSSRQRTNDNCRRLSKKAQVREMNWHLFSFLPLVPLVKRGGGGGMEGTENTWSLKQSYCAPIKK